MLDLLSAAAGDQVSQPYLLEARQMQALTLGVHIPLVCSFLTEDRDKPEG